MKIVINGCFGGFSLSLKAICYLRFKYMNKHLKDFYILPEDLRPFSFDSFHPDIPRNDPDLVRVVEELGKEANGAHAELRIVEIPDCIDYYIDEYDGVESVNEVHRSWS